MGRHKTCPYTASKGVSTIYLRTITRIFSKHLFSILTVGICVIFALPAAAQTPSLAEQIFQKHQTRLLSEDVQAVLPAVLVELKKNENQAILTPVLIEAVLENPDLLKRLIPEISDEFITLLKQQDSGIRILFSDPDFQTLLQMPDAIDELTRLIEPTEPSLATQIFERYERFFQRQDIRELLPDVLTALNQPDKQALLRPALIKLVTEDPDLLKVIAPEIDDRFITLLKEDPEVNIFIKDPDFHVLLQDPDAINELAVLLDIETVAIMRIRPASIESPDIRALFAVDVVIDNARNVQGYQLSVHFDPEALRYVSWQQGTYLSGDVFAGLKTIAAGQISFVVTAPTEATNTQGVLLTITFEVVAAKASILSLSDVILVSGQRTALPVKTEGSEIVKPILVATEDSVQPIPEGTEADEAVEPMSVETEEGGSEETEGSEVVEPTSEETEDSVEPMPEGTENSEIIEPTLEETEDGVEPVSGETEEGEVVEPMPVETEDSEGVEPTSEETEDGETVEPAPEGTETEVERLTPAWDVNEDRFVNILDLVLVRLNFGQEGPTPADVNGDNVVNILDLTLVASHLGEYYEQP